MDKGKGNGSNGIGQIENKWQAFAFFLKNASLFSLIVLILVGVYLLFETQGQLERERDERIEAYFSLLLKHCLHVGDRERPDANRQ